MEVVVDVFLTWLLVMLVCGSVLSVFYFKGDMLADKFKRWKWKNFG